MFLKKKQTESGTDDILQQIKEKISDAGGANDGGSVNPVSEQNLISQNTDNANANLSYSDEDDELLNMLLSDDNEDDEDNEDNEDNEDDEDEDDDNFNDLSNNNDNNTETKVSSNNNDDIVDDVNNNDDEEDMSLSNNDVDDEKDNDKYVEELEDDDNGSIIDDDLKLNNVVADGNGNQNDRVNTIENQFVDDDIDEDDIEFYDKNNDDVETNEDDAMLDDSENVKSNNNQELMEDEDGIENSDDEMNTKSYEDEEIGGRVKVYDDNQLQDDEMFADIRQHETIRPLFKKQDGKKVNKGFSAVSISDDTKRSVRKNISSLIEQVKRQVVDERVSDLDRGAGGKTLEQIAVDLIQPVVIDYLNNNLERIVSDIVNEEIKRITDDIDK